MSEQGGREGDSGTADGNGQEERGGEIELRSGRWRWFDLELAAEDGDGSAIVRSVLYLGSGEGDIMRRWLPADGGAIDQERARTLAACTDEREFFVPGGQCVAREDPSSRPGARRLHMRLPGGHCVMVDSPGNLCLGELTHDELCDAMQAGLRARQPEGELAEA